MIAVRVQAGPFDAGMELAALQAGDGIGAVASFIGVVRAPAAALTLEHYPGMTERSIRAIADDAQARWPIKSGTIVHRIGRMMAGESIVLIAVTSPHRAAALEACGFLIDQMKTNAPFWKKEEVGGEESWVEARVSDDDAAARWDVGGPGRT